ncbi:MAG: PAS domain-containing protein, partial [Deltaproteobacteria bacterium]|nr:PAS domain-containing protein [Candidatus Tharpella sp.]
MRRLVLVCILFLLLAASGQAQPSPGDKVFQILVLTSYHRSHVWTEAIVNGLHDELQTTGISVITKSPNVPMLDYMVMQQFEISLANMPVETIVINQPESFYFKNKRIIWFSASLFLLLILVIVVLLINVLQRRRYTVGLRKLNESLELRIGERTAELRKSENKFRSMMESMTDLVYICSDSFRIEYMNPAMLKWLGREALGELCYQALYGFEKPCSWCRGEEGRAGR